MYCSKDQHDANVDSGLGDSFVEPLESPSTETQIQNGVGELQLEDNLDKNAKENQQRILQFLRQAYTPDEDSDTYLHLFIARGLKPNALQLIEICPKSELFDIQNNLGQAAIHVATYVNFHDIASELVLHGARLDLVDKDGKNVFHLCAERGHMESLNSIMKAACQTNQVKGVYTLLNERDFSGLTPFHLAVSNKHYKICQRLVDMKVDVNLPDSRNFNSPLHEAVMHPECNESFIGFLLKQCKLDVNFPNGAGVTALHIAASKGDTSMCALLLSHGGDKSIADMEGNTPIIYAANKEVHNLLAK